MTDELTDGRLKAIEDKLAELELMVTTTLRLLAATRPLGRMLEQFGTTEEQELAVYSLLDGMVQRLDGDPRDAPTYAELQEALWHHVPGQRGNREFTGVVLDTLPVERVAYRRLHDFLRRSAR